MTDENQPNPLIGMPTDAWIELQRETPEQEWLLWEAIAPAGLTIVCGRPKKGKSFLAYLMAISLSSGREIGPFKPAGKIPCLYIDQEGVAKHTAQRLELMIRGLARLEKDLANMHMVHGQEFELLSGNTVQELIDAVKSTGARVVFIDTFAATFTGEENSKRDVQAYLDKLKLIRQATGAAVVLVHHTNKAQFQWKDASVPMDPDGGLRGSSAIAGAYDVIFSLQDGWVNGRFMDVMMSRGKYTPEWYCQYELKTDAKEGQEPTAHKLVFHKRHEGLDFFTRAPDGRQPGFSPSRKNKQENDDE